ncbi:hypothetical protein CLG94_00625 [Candidatus Methylomirabilis limnetica]|jgi:hypothetical protein|uniref:Lcl C-terminal domain-containing protein n=1 Tax=Candidatus Methylomirabilis limnetica TaxID=2033718 RepID=A0A2T4U145_9BACT|nr:DUF1566 domain-containing protein [Candidatus Methylomirabilis limnetica]PTL37069.1 hypothetical protein CLG94_00625 [Candidatus Methylomirabilis limnetica]
MLRDFKEAAVLDWETGLVWEQSPENSKSNPTFVQNWHNAQASCNFRTVGGRKGWRLPTIQELASLVDPTQSSPALPRGHPFSNVHSSPYWSATTNTIDSSFAWDLDLDSGNVFNLGKTAVIHVWCVRGGQGSILSDSVI